MDATVARGFTPIDMDKGFVLSLFHGFRKCVPEATRKLIVREEGEVLQYLLAVRPRLMPFSHRHPLSLRHPAVSMMSRHYFSLLRVIKGGTHRSKRSSHSGSTVLELPGITSNLAESNVRHGQLSLLLDTKTIKAEKLCSHNWDCVDFCYKLLLSESPFASMALERLLFDGRLVDVIQRYWDRITCPLMEFESGAPVEGGLHDEAHSPPSSGSGGPRRAFYMTPTQYAYLHMRFAQILLPPGALEAEILDSILADLRIDGRYPQHSLYCSNTQMDSRLSRISQAVDVLMDPQQYLSPRTQSPNLGSSMLDEAPEAKAVSPHPSKPHDALMALPDVSFAQFFYSMIEFADNWTSTTHPSEYVTFLVELYCEVFGHDWDDDDPAFKRAYQSSARTTVKEGLDNEESQQIDSAEELLADYGKLLSSLKPGKVKTSQSLVVPEFGDELGHRGSDDTDLFDLTLSASVRGLSSGEQGGSKDGGRYAAGRLAGRGREENERSEESEEYDAAGGPGTSLRAKHSKRSSRDRHGHRSRRHRRSSSKDASPSPSGTSKVRHGNGAAKESAGLGLSESGRHGSMRRESARVGGRMLSDDGVLYGRRDDFEDSQGSFEYFMDEEEVAVQAEGKISEKDTEAAAAAKLKRPRRDRASKMGGEGHEGSGAKATSIDSRGPKGSRKDRDRHATTEYGALSPHFGGDNSQSLISGDESLTTSMSSQSGTPTYGSGLEPIRRGRHLRALRKGHRSSRQSPDGFSDSGSRLGTPDFRRKTDARLPFHGTAQKMKGRRARGSPSSTTADSQDDQPIGDYGGSGAGRSPHRGKFLYDGEWLTPEEIKYRERAIRYGRSPRSYKSSLSPGGESDLGAVPARTSSLSRHVGGEHTGADGDMLGYPAGVVQPEEDWGSENFDESQKGQVVDKYVLNRNRHPSYERHRVAAETLNSHRDAIMRRLWRKALSYRAMPSLMMMF
ncbi:unnamed protein product [Trypanosoma congolense IL3000]|uniref:WGS project CAEQ00000000 data, annotated contig 1911 n=1 Tax=Trypanosoma congolense (strain IL3000) TaxID=1068625 RepID=F9W9Y4_TRYCI|nr:unnamed protein product [Trypanosoma congolense IL3000]